MVLKFFVGYLLVGQIINWGTVFFTIWMLLRKCKGHDDVFSQLSEEHNKHVIPPDSTPDPAAFIGNLLVVVMNIVLWPRKVVMMLFLLSDQLKLADELLNSDTN